MYPELTGKVALVTGAGGALGAAVARRLDAEGMHLALLDVAQPSLDLLAQDLRNPSWARAADLSRPESVDAAVDGAEGALGPVYAVVNAAGGFVYSGVLAEADPEDLDRMIDMNLRTAFLMCRAASSRMRRAGAGRIVNLAARAGLQGAAGMAAYSASKAAVLRLTESLAADLLDTAITVNAVLPSTIDTPRNRKEMSSADFTRWVAPGSLAAVIAFLLSDSAADVRGASIPVYGQS